MAPTSAAGVKPEIFVGGLPYNATDDGLRAIFSAVGRVVNVRIMSDRETQKQKGYAFIEYENVDVALSAIRNLANAELEGRKLRIGFSNNSNLEELAKQRGIVAPSVTQQTNREPVTTPIESALSKFRAYEMWDMLASLKELAETKPEELRLLFTTHPQIAEATVQMQIKLGMVKAPPVRQPPPPSGPPPQQPPPQTSSTATSTQQAQQPPAPPATPAQPPVIYPLHQTPANPPPRAYPLHTMPPPPPSGPPPPPPPAPVAGLTPEQVRSVMEVTPEQLQQLDPVQRQALLEVRQQVLAMSQHQPQG